MTALAFPFRCILDLGVSVALEKKTSVGRASSVGQDWHSGKSSYLICMPEPRRALFLTTDQRYPIIAASTESFPDIRVAVHSSRTLRLMELASRCRADPVAERLVVPESRVLENQPATGLANPTPPLALVAMTTYPAWGVQVAIKAKILFVWDKIRVRRIHVLFRRCELRLLKRSEEIGRVREICVPIRLLVNCFRITLKHSEESV